MSLEAPGAPMATSQGCVQCGDEDLSRRGKLPTRHRGILGPLELPVPTLHCPLPHSVLTPGPCPQSALCIQQISVTNSIQHLSSKCSEPDTVLSSGYRTEAGLVPARGRTVLRGTAACRSPGRENGVQAHGTSGKGRVTNRGQELPGKKTRKLGR